MKYHKLIRFLDLEKIEYFKNHNLSKYNTMKINAISKVFVIVKSTDKLRRLLSFLSSLKMNYYLLGNGSNTLFVDKKIYKPIIKLEYNDDVFIHNGFMLVNASITNSKISNFLMRNGYSNFEFASVIPGTIGAGIALNSSYKNKSFSDNLMYVEVIDKKGNSHWLSKEMLKFSYRSSSILEKNLIVTRALDLTYPGGGSTCRCISRLG